MISFKGTHFPKDVILYAVFFYVRYGVSYRDLEEIMEVGAPSYLMKYLGLLSPNIHSHTVRIG
ncbi:Mobile element protein [methanotrophic endosymbiont of Bathymodiolus azoricus (Menez Gwen)]|nr:Mobile element protein [methanotrophic endosymbiont of Bathymodiolus azoricus (Menez Gwen)]